MITVGKNPALVWEALQVGGIDADLLLAGSLTPEIADWARSVAPTVHGEVIVREGFLPDDELDKLVATANVVPLAMTHNGPSGIMGKALAAGVPVVTAGSKVRPGSWSPPMRVRSPSSHATVWLSYQAGAGAGPLATTAQHRASRYCRGVRASTSGVARMT